MSWIYIKKKIFIGSLKSFTILMNYREKEARKLSMKSKTLKNIWLWKIRRNKRKKISVNKLKIIPTLTPTPIITAITTAIIIAKKAIKIKSNSQIEKKEYFQLYPNIPKSMNLWNRPSLSDGSSIIAIFSDNLSKIQCLFLFKSLASLKMDQHYFKMLWRIKDQVKTIITIIIITIIIMVKNHGTHLFSLVWPKSTNN